MKRKRLWFFAYLTTLFLCHAAEAAVLSIPDNTIDTVPPVGASTNISFTGPISGGTLEIQANQIFTPGFIINGNAGLGILVLDSNSQCNCAASIASGVSPLNAITLNGNATASSPANIAAQTFNLGVNTLTVPAGVVQLSTGGDLTINTTVLSDAIYGNITGAAGLNIGSSPILVNVDATDATLTGGASLTLLSSSGGNVNNPVIVTSNNPLYSFTGVNFPMGDIVITAFLNSMPIPIPILPFVPGVGGVGTELLAIATNNPGSDIASVMTAITALPSTSAMASALLQFNPIVDGSTPWVSFEASQQFQNLWSKHMENGRCIYGAECDDDCYNGKKLTDEEEVRCEKIEKAGCDSSVNCDDVKNRFEIWADGFGYRGSRQGSGGINGYSANIWGGMLGFQAPLDQMWSIGIGGGYAHSHVHRKKHRGKSTIQTYDATGYLSYDATHWYFDGVFSFDYHRYHDTREILFPGVDRTASAHYHGQQYTGLLDTGYRLYTGCTIFTPLASLQYSNLHVHSFHESGAGDLDLHVESQNYNYVESTLGLKITRPVQIRSGALVPEVHAFWLHDFYANRMDLDGTTLSGLAAGAGSFDLTGSGIKRNRGDVGAGITFISCMDLSLQLVYNYEFTSNFHANEGLAKLSFAF